jgi:hypothetical protein
VGSVNRARAPNKLRPSFSDLGFVTDAGCDSVQHARHVAPRLDRELSIMPSVSFGNALIERSDMANSFEAD